MLAAKFNTEKVETTRKKLKEGNKMSKTRMKLDT